MSEFDPAKVMPIVYEEVSKEFGIDCCIISTATMIDVLDRVYGIPAYPLPVEVSIFNPWVTRKIEKSGTFPDAKQLIKWTTKSPKGWAVGIGQDGHGKATDGTGGFNGHMVAVATDGGGKSVLMDTALGQATRPQKKMNLAPVSFAVRESFISGEKNAGWKQFGCLFLYRGITHNKDFRSSSAWDKLNRLGAVERVVNRVSSVPSILMK